MPTTAEIQDYLTRYQRPDEQIAEKSRSRVTRALAINVKENNPLPKGRCNICSKEDEKLLPASMKICPTCCNKFIQRGGELRVLQKETAEHYCDYCMVRTFITLLVNPLVCQWCGSKIGRLHKLDGSDLMHQKRKDVELKKEFGMGI